MKITVAIDSFKGSLSSTEAEDAAMQGILKAIPNAEIYMCPIADGGEGTTEAIITSSGGRFREIIVSDPLLRPIKAQYGITGKTAVIETAAAAGIALLSPDELNPLNTSTYGIGELIRDAISSGVRDFIIGLGGSATNDGGTGMLSALGFEFNDRNGKRISPGAKGLADLYSIDTKNALHELSECMFRIACDVTNPLCGKNGCSAVFARQKGADDAMINKMDKWLARYADITKALIPTSDMNLPGSGAAGGLGFAFLSYLNSTFVNGLELVSEATMLEKYIKVSDFVVTGEGQLDSQTSMGKAPTGVAKIAKKYNKTVIAFAGSIADGAEACNCCGIDAFFPIVRSAMCLEEAMNKDNAKRNISAAAQQVFRLIKALKTDFIHDLI